MRGMVGEAVEKKVVLLLMRNNNIGTRSSLTIVTWSETRWPRRDNLTNLIAISDWWLLPCSAYKCAYLHPIRDIAQFMVT